MATAFGPQGPNYTTTRPPADPQASAGVDTWFKNCSAAGAKDGTFATAAFFNVLVGNLRYLVRTSGVALDDVSDTMVFDAINQMVSNGEHNYAVDVGGVNAVAVTLPVTVTSYTAGMTVYVKIGNDNTGGSTLNINTVGAKAILRPDGSTLRRGDLLKGEVAELVFDGTNFYKIGLSGLTLTAPRTYYVDGANGSDANDGLQPGAGHAFGTVQKAVDTAQVFNLNGFQITIQVADMIATNYDPVTLPLINGSGSISIVGNPSNPSNVHIHANAGPAVTCNSPGYSLIGVQLSSSARDLVNLRPSTGVWGIGTCNINVQNIVWGACADNHMIASTGVITIGGTQRIVGGSGSHYLVSFGGKVITTSGPTTPVLVIPSAVSITTFAVVVQSSLLSAVYGSITGAGNVTGAKYSASGNSIIDTNAQGINYLPGSTPGGLATGAQYL
jgi:hypothetical protein